MNGSQIFHFLPGVPLEKVDTPPFDEIIISWNGPRPLHIQVSLFTEKGWSPFLKYVEWEKNNQKTFQTDLYPLIVDQDCIKVQDGKATGFRIKVIKNQSFINLFACTTNLVALKPDPFIPPSQKIQLDVPHFYQFSLCPKNGHRICSPVSTAAVIQYLLNKPVDPLDFAEKVRDHHFDIYGNWVLNVAQAYIEMGNPWCCFVTRLKGLNDLIDSLKMSIPPVISIKGPILGGALPYEQGHLMVIVGFDPSTNQFLCMDPAFPTGTPIRYGSHDLETAWKRRGFISYICKRLISQAF